MGDDNRTRASNFGCKYAPLQSLKRVRKSDDKLLMEQKCAASDFESTGEEMTTQSKLLVLGLVVLTIMFAGVPNLIESLGSRCANGSCSNYLAADLCPTGCPVTAPRFTPK